MYVINCFENITIYIIPNQNIFTFSTWSNQREIWVKWYCKYWSKWRITEKPPCSENIRDSFNCSSLLSEEGLTEVKDITSSPLLKLILHPWTPEQRTPSLHPNPTLGGWGGPRYYRIPERKVPKLQKGTMFLGHVQTYLTILIHKISSPQGPSEPTRGYFGASDRFVSIQKWISYFDWFFGVIYRMGHRGTVIS